MLIMLLGVILWLILPVLVLYLLSGFFLKLTPFKESAVARILFTIFLYLAVGAVLYVAITTNPKFASSYQLLPTMILWPFSVIAGVLGSD